MPKQFTFPTLYDEVKTINLADLKRWGYLKPNQIHSGTLTWSRDGMQTGSISFYVNTSNGMHLHLSYKSNEESINYRIDIIEKPSNLGKGNVLYFLCPRTHKLCRKLYLVGGYFLHRKAFTGCMYESQTQCKKIRRWNNVLGAYFNSDKYYNQLYKKHFKKTYAGKPTKKYKRLSNQIKKAESIDYRDVELLMMI